MFKPVTLEYKGKQYTVEVKKLLPLIAEVEEVLTITEICSTKFKKAPKLVKLAEAYAIALRHAGAKVTAIEVYQEIFATPSNIGHTITAAIAGLLSLMIPPDAVNESKENEEVEDQKKT